jgi:alpha-galactosidase
MLPRFNQRAENESTHSFETCGTTDHMGPKPVDIYRRFGAVPISDIASVSNGAWDCWCHNC